MFRAFKSTWKRVRAKLFPFLVAYPGLGLLRIILMTCRIHVSGIDSFAKTAQAKRCILMLWHNRLSIMAYVLTRHAPQYTYSAFISKSRDGDLITAVVNSYQQGRVIRVAQHCSHLALKEMIKQLKTGQDIMLITPDGPRGPKYRAKPGVILAAQIAEATIIPVTWSADRFWQLKSWDRLIFPKPFSKIFVSIGEPISEGNVNELQDNLNMLTQGVCAAVSGDPEKWPK